MSAASAHTLSASEIDYQAEGSEFFDEDTLVIEFLSTTQESTETLEFELDPERVERDTDGTTEQSLEVFVDNQEQWAEYQILDLDKDPIHEFEFSETSFDTESGADQHIENACVDLTGDGMQSEEDYWKWSTGGGWFSDPTWHVVCGDGAAGDSRFVSGIEMTPDRFFLTEWVVDAEDRVEQDAVLTNSLSQDTGLVGSGEMEGTSDRISPNVHVRWNGNLQTGSSYPSPQNTLAAYSTDTGWTLINEDEYDEYIDFKQNEAPDIIEEIATSLDCDLEDCTSDPSDTAQTLHSEAVQTYDSSPILDSAGTVEGPDADSINEFRDGVFQYFPETGTGTEVPSFTLYVNAVDYFVVDKQLGAPEIVDAEDIDILESEGAEDSQVTVENTGTGTGEFASRVECTQGFTGTSIAQTPSIGAGETFTFTPSISFSDEDVSSEEVDGSCEFTVEEVNTGEEDTIVFDATGVKDPTDTCEEGERIRQVEIREFDGEEVATEVIYECTGVSYDREIEVCGPEETAERTFGGELECVEEDRPGDGSLEECEVVIAEFGDRQYTTTNPVCAVQNALGSMFNSVSSFFSSVTLLGASIASLAVGGYVALFGYGMGRRQLPEAFGIQDERIKIAGGIAGLLLGLLVATLVFTLLTSLVFQIMLIAGLAVLYYVGLLPTLLKFALASR